jgi:hypothetical protein
MFSQNAILRQVTSRANVVKRIPPIILEVGGYYKNKCKYVGLQTYFYLNIRTRKLEKQR